ncbi:2-amino-4-hydroxy-6-hydroxymethyldihydropteridine diphosphokinase [Erythrobacter sp. THAF29]|uniref:2-amino-4-hydroxy-6- hydroxymethyldihydropteridine diphosphokinase n=1 Tax=Erythrobacter sp. THAF29 TaxID=2587851 RepID=UPI001268D011|nr:2-amino-4-hydroxy-6-hydroxymethyldihydropteridine diphosphokinase [Erythrobacter sp. THAF29]QFT76758.1 2-amino-4-hydroxy-6-hydroxymethyldihydropteridine pyrophosphokinase [Erythrobacter sp. THAF29]
MSSTYLVAIGSNRRHHLYGNPHEIVRAAMEELTALGTVTARSAIVATSPIGPAQRRFANAAVLLESEYDPPSLLAGLKHAEREFGRRSFRRWGDRVLDLDIILWSGGHWGDSSLTIPHAEFRKRAFVLGPASTIAPAWRDPISGLSLIQLNARLTRARTLPR